MQAGDPDGAQARLAQARTLLTGDLVFGWRLELKHRLITGRLALLRGDPEAALAAAAELETRAAALGVPRYVGVARVLTHRARRALRLPVDLDAVAADLDLVEESVAVEAWWWTGETAADFAVPAWLDVAADQAERLARQAGDHADTLRRAAAQRLDGWRAERQRAVSTSMSTTSGPVPVTAASAARRSSARRAAVSELTNGATWAMPSRHAASSAGRDSPVSTVIVRSRMSV